MSPRPQEQVTGIPGHQRRSPEDQQQQREGAPHTATAPGGFGSETARAVPPRGPGDDTEHTGWPARKAGERHEGAGARRPASPEQNVPEAYGGRPGTGVQRRHRPRREASPPSPVTAGGRQKRDRPAGLSRKHAAAGCGSGRPLPAALLGFPSQQRERRFSGAPRSPPGPDGRGEGGDETRGKLETRGGTRGGGDGRAFGVVWGSVEE